MRERSKLSYAMALLPDRLKAAVLSAGQGEREKITELRLRRGRSLSAVLYGREYFLTYDGRFMNSFEGAVEVTAEDISQVFTRAFRGSVHSFPREMAQGYITCEGGNRVGFCGTAVSDRVGEVTSVKDISSINIRIAREVIGCAEAIFDRAFSDGLASLVIASPPCGGKTTVLRDLCRLLGERRRVSIIDERGELASVYEGEPQNDVGARSDIFNAYDKSAAVVTAVKVMSPDVLVCDEIGAKGDLEALEYALNSSVRLVCTCHAADFDDLKKRPAVGRLMKQGYFDFAAMLGTGAMCGRLTAFYKLKDD